MSHPITATAYMPPPEVRTGIPIPTHNHDGRYYTKEESNLSMVAEAEARESGDVALGDDIDELVLVVADKADKSTLTAHTSSTSNPHGVTAAQTGAETTAQLNARDTANRSRANHTGTQAQSTIEGLELDLADKAAASALAAHVADTGNPHGVTSAQIGAVASNVTGITGAIVISNHVAISAEDYNAIAVPDPNTIYEIIA